MIAWWPSEASAESQVVQMMEGELRLGLGLPLESYTGYGNVRGHGELGLCWGIEGRYNFKGTPWDCGLTFEMSPAIRRFNNPLNDGYDRHLANRIIALAAVGDYNFIQGKKINPFVGVELGVAHNDVQSDSFPTWGGSTSMLFAPRAGVEFVHHIRLMAKFNICRKGYNTFALSIGFVVGGRPKK
ncbi:MAG: hypothetical protein K2N88_00015 [Muribaculaceae bacterium]|nr:hypothetical protein [Muribaculaceae bacterium]